MRTALVVAAALASPALTGGAALAQAVERTDVPDRGVLRVTFDPQIMGWDTEFTDAGRRRPGAPLTGDTVGAASIPAVARLEQDVRVASGVSGFVASLGKGLLSVRQERRTYPVTAELGVTDRLSVRLMVPIVRVATRAHLKLSSQGANLGLNPRLRGVANASTLYNNFFTQFDTTLARLDTNVAAGMYSCPPSRQCPAQAFLDSARTTRDALHRTVYGVGLTGSPFMPLDSSAAGQAIGQQVSYFQKQLDSAYTVMGFASAFLLAHDTLSPDLITGAIVDEAIGFGYRLDPFRNSFRYGLGDVEVAAKYRFATGPRYAAAAVGLVRLPTAMRDSANDLLRQSSGDRQLDLEGRLIQELIVANRLWLNLAIRAGIQRPGTRIRRVAPFAAFLVPHQATAELRWNPGDYLGVDLAPLYRFAPRFAAGVTAGYWSRARDHYAFRSPQDSVTLAARLGAPTAASVLDQGTSERLVRLGVAVTYVGPRVEGGFSVEQTVTGAGRVAAATVYRIVLRASQKLF